MPRHSPQIPLAVVPVFRSPPRSPAHPASHPSRSGVPGGRVVAVGEVARVIDARLGRGRAEVAAQTARGAAARPPEAVAVEA